MAAEMKDDLLTYTETAKEIGMSPSYIPTLVARGKLKAVKPVWSKKKKYIDRRDIDNYKRGFVSIEVQYTETQHTETQTSIFTGKAASVRDALERVSDVFSKISGDYKDTVSPVIKHVVETDEEVILA